MLLDLSVLLKKYNVHVHVHVPLKHKLTKPLRLGIFQTHYLSKLATFNALSTNRHYSVFYVATCKKKTRS